MSNLTIIVDAEKFEALMLALERANLKGYLPDAMCDEWEAFDWTEVTTAPAVEPVAVMEALASLRHLYANLTGGGVVDTSSAVRIATGLLGPAIEKLERVAASPAEQAATQAEAKSFYNEIFQSIRHATKIEGERGIGVSVAAFKDELARQGCIVAPTAPTGAQAEPLTDERIAAAFYEKDAEGNWATGGCNMEGFKRAVRWTEARHIQEKN